MNRYKSFSRLTLTALLCYSSPSPITAAAEPTQTRPASEVEVKWPPIEIPNFASVQLIGTIDLEKKSYSLAGVLEKKIEAGPLSADKSWHFRYFSIGL